MGSVVSGLVGSITGKGGADAAKSGAEAQSEAANNAAQMTQQQLEQMRSDLAPYRALGTGTQNALMQALGYNGAFDKDGNLTGMSVNPNAALQQKFSFNPADLSKTPGYQFALQQGLKGTNNALSAQGLGLSGAQAKGLSSFTTGLADQTYNQQYNNALSTYNTNYQTASNNANNLMNLMNVGQNAAAQTGTAGLNAANTAGGYLTGGANAQAAGGIGAANSYGNALNNAVGTGTSLYALSALLSDQRFKEDIRLVGQTEEGLPIYVYRYKGDPVYHMGVMAQEAEAKNPDSITEKDGVKYVRYEQIK